MLKSFAGGAEHIILATGATDFRKQITSLSAMVTMQYHMDPFADGYVFIFCNRRRNAIKVLRYDNNGFVLATKKLLDGMKFQWPRNKDEVKEITGQQLEWLLDGLEIEQKKKNYKCCGSWKKNRNSSFLKKMKLSADSRFK